MTEPYKNQIVSTKDHFMKANTEHKSHSNAIQSYNFNQIDKKNGDRN